MITNKYVTPSFFIVGLILFNIYEYYRMADGSSIPFLLVASFLGFYKSDSDSKFKDMFNLYRIKNLFKGSFWAFELLAAMLLVISMGYESYQLLNVMSISDLLLEVVYFIVFTFVLYRFFTFNLFKDKSDT